MNVKKNQVSIIVLSVLWGYLSAAFFFLGPSMDWMYNDFTGYIYLLFLASTAFCNIVFNLIGVFYPGWMAAGIYFVMQTIIYLVTGWLIASVYGRWKNSKVSQKEVEPVLEDDEQDD